MVHHNYMYYIAHALYVHCTIPRTW